MQKYRISSNKCLPSYTFCTSKWGPNQNIGIFHNCLNQEAYGAYFYLQCQSFEG